MIGAGLLMIATDWACRTWLGEPLYRLPLRFGFIRALPLFLLGVAAALFGSRIYSTPVWAGRIGLLALVGLVATQVIGHFALVTVVLLTVLIWAAGALPTVRPSRLIEHLGLMSFAMFLTNEVSRIVWFGVFDALGHSNWPLGLRWGVWSAGLVTAFLAAAVFRYGFDRPAQAWLNPSRRPVIIPGASSDRPIA